MALSYKHTVSHKLCLHYFASCERILVRMNLRLWMAWNYDCGFIWCNSFQTSNEKSFHMMEAGKCSDILSHILSHIFNHTSIYQVIYYVIYTVIHSVIYSIIQTYTKSYTQLYTQLYKHIHSHILSHTNIYTVIYSVTYSIIQTYTKSYTQLYTQSYKRIHSHILSHIHSHILSHIHSHTLSHTNIYQVIHSVIYSVLQTYTVSYKSYMHIPNHIQVIFLHITADEISYNAGQAQITSLSQSSSEAISQWALILVINNNDNVHVI